MTFIYCNKWNIGRLFLSLLLYVCEGICFYSFSNSVWCLGHEGCVQHFKLQIVIENALTVCERPAIVIDAVVAVAADKNVAGT